MSFELRLKAFDTDADYENAIQAILAQLVQRAAEVLNTPADNIVVRGAQDSDITGLGAGAAAALLIMDGSFTVTTTSAGLERTILSNSATGSVPAAATKMTVPNDQVVCLAGIIEPTGLLNEITIRNSVGIIGRYDMTELKRRGSVEAALFSRALIFGPQDNFDVSGVCPTSNAAIEAHVIVFIAEKNGNNVSVA